ncbi:unnamed protein product [Blepharisma stoltei]|uniref:Peptidyl-prolyl cis-trans isomerase n=1 Tax=Blepharisma stoltei TaxID=1481888 RepID=A0AAU9K3A0_9CILI|nr:unnamed protein product [Blepharisma stoltei]
MQAITVNLKLLFIRMDNHKENSDSDANRQSSDAASTDRLLLEGSIATKERKKYVHWQVRIGDSPEQKVVIELDFASCPRTCENFWQIANSYKDLSYRGSLFHRIVPNGYIEGGFLNLSDGTKANSSIYGTYFSDENYSYLHDKPGVIGMSNSGKHKNGSVFYITLRPMAHLNGRLVGFGRVVEGFDVIKAISQVPCKNQRPLVACSILSSGNYLNSLPDENKTRLHKDHFQSKLEAADLNTLMSRREAIVKEIESTREELEEQRKFRDVISNLIADMMAY